MLDRENGLFLDERDLPNYLIEILDKNCSLEKPPKEKKDQPEQPEEMENGVEEENIQF